MYAEFKEKTFEKYFGFEIARQTTVAYSPDQCDESLLGFDDAFFLDPGFLRRWGFIPRRWRAAIKHGLTIAEIDRTLQGILRHLPLPPFRFNLFIQYKRPEYLRQPQSSEWKQWQRPYYRFDLTPHQQKLLEGIGRTATARAAVIYASAAFWKKDDLFNFAQNEVIIQNSNIAHAHSLAGHDRYTYAEAGSKGIACSEPTDVSGPSFSEIIELVRTGGELSFSQHLKRAAALVVAAAQEDRPLYSRLVDARRALGFVEFTDNSLVDALATLEALSDAFDISYYALG